MNEYHARHAGLLEPGAITHKRILLVGCGSVGSEAARLFTRAGVGALTLADPDLVTESNLCRTVYEVADVGAPKVDALAAHLKRIRPEVEVDARAVSLRTVGDEELSSWITATDLVFAATDDPGTQARLGALSYHHVPAVFAGVYAKGTGGEVIWTRPDETPCYACVLGSLRGANEPARGRAAYGLEPGRLDAEPALGVDILRVTVAAVKIGLALLVGGTGRAFEGLLDPNRSVLFLGNVVDWIWHEPLETVWAHATRREHCICRLGPTGSTADLVDDADPELDFTEALLP